MYKSYKALFTPHDNGEYTVAVPALPGCATQGATFDEALANINQAVTVHLEKLKAEGKPAPDDNVFLIDIDTTIEETDNEVSGIFHDETC